MVLLTRPVLQTQEVSTTRYYLLKTTDIPCNSVRLVCQWWVGDFQESCPRKVQRNFTGQCLLNDYSKNFLKQPRYLNLTTVAKSMLCGKYLIFLRIDVLLSNL